MIAREVFDRAVRRGLAIMGDVSLLDGNPCGSVHVARSVEVYAGIMDNANDNHVARADVARIAVEFSPRIGQVLEHPTHGRFVLTRLTGDDGFKRSFIITKAPA